MQHPFRTILAPVALAIAAACGGSQPLDESLVRDLDRVQSGALELALPGQSLQVVSEVEGGPAARPTPVAEARPRTVARRASAPRAPAPRAAEPRLVASQPVAQRPAARGVEAPLPVAAPAPAVADYPATPRPESAPLGAGPPPPGGWKSVGEVLRTIPIPIKP
jgi:hypothetical protein